MSIITINITINNTSSGSVGWDFEKSSVERNDAQGIAGAGRNRRGGHGSGKALIISNS